MATATWISSLEAGWRPGFTLCRATAECFAVARGDLLLTGPTTLHSVHLDHGNYNGDGVVGMVPPQLDPRLLLIAPFGTPSRLAQAIPAARVRTATFAAYADAGIDQVLGDAIRRGGRVEARTLDHMLFLHRGSHFQPVPLAVEAQFAPAFAATVADLDGDGTEGL